MNIINGKSKFMKRKMNNELRRKKKEEKISHQKV